MAHFPVRCFTCGKVIATKTNIETFFLLTEEKGMNQKNALDRIGMRRRCCRRMFLSYAPELENRMLLYPGINLARKETDIDNWKENLPHIGK